MKHFIAAGALLIGANVCQADTQMLHLFTVVGSGKQIEYKARVNNDCSFAGKEPVDAIVVDPNGASHKANWLESKFVAFDYIQRASQKVVAEVKVFKNNHIHWPLTLVVALDNAGRCQGAALGSNDQEMIERVEIKRTENRVPKELVVFGNVQGRPVQTPVSF